MNFVFARHVQLLYFCLDRVPNSSRLSPLSVWHSCFIFGLSWLIITAHRMMVSFVFPQFLQKNLRLIPWITPRLLPSSPFVIRYSLITSSVDAIWLQDYTKKKKQLLFVASYIRDIRIHIWWTDGDFIMKWSHSFVKKMKLFKRYVPEEVKKNNYRGCYCVKQEFEKAVSIQNVAFGIVTPYSLVGGCGSPYWTLGGNRLLQNFFNHLRYYLF